MELTDRRILITGPTSQVGRPVTSALASQNDVIGIARFSDEAARADLEAVGVRCVPVDLVDPDFSAVPTDVDVVLNFAVTKTGDFVDDLAANAEATGLLMHHLELGRRLPALLVDRRLPARRRAAVRRGLTAR